MNEKEHTIQTPSKIMVVIDRINNFGISNQYWGILKHESEVGYFSSFNKNDTTPVPPCLYITNDCISNFTEWFPTPDMKITDEDNIVYYIYFL